jgi:hypothetical protein
MTDANTDYTDLLDATTTNHNITAKERETSIAWSAEDERARILSEEKHVMRRLLAHPEFVLDFYYQSSDDNEWGERVEADEYDGDHDGRKSVFGVSGTVPVTAFSLKTRSPNSGGHARTVTAKWLKELRDAGEVDV